MSLSIFNKTIELKFPINCDIIEAKIAKSKIVIGNYTYTCKKAEEAYEFIPNANSFLAGNSLIPFITVVIDSLTFDESKIILKGRVHPWAKAFTVFFIGFLLFLLLIGSIAEGPKLTGVLIIISMLTFMISFIKVSLVVNLHLFKKQLNKEIQTI